jgi:hypothetical protein
METNTAGQTETTETLAADQLGRLQVPEDPPARQHLSHDGGGGDPNAG